MQQRLFYIDNLKTLAILGVILGHAITYVGVKSSTWNLISQIPWNMPLFMLISGFLSYKTLSRMNNVDALKIGIEHISDKVAIPALFFTLFSFAVSHITSGGILVGLIAIAVMIALCYLVRSNNRRIYRILLYVIVLANICAKPAYYWYMTMYVSVFSFSVLFAYCCNRKEWVKLSIVTLVALASFYLFPLRGIDLFSSFAFGVLLKAIEIKVGNVQRWQILLTLLVCISISIAIFPMVYNHDSFYQSNAFQLILTNQTGFLLIRQIAQIFSAFALFLLFYLLLNVKCVFMQLVGSRTMYIYMYHAFIISLLEKTTLHVPSSFISLIITVIALLLVSLAIDAIIRRIGFLSLFLNGTYKNSKI
jgi:fucose 4-O-acetylase-like acetyltransferase